MDPKIKLMLLYEALSVLIQNELELIIKDQLQINALSERKKINPNLINIQQTKLNARFINFNSFKEAFKQLPALIDQSIINAEAEGEKKYKNLYKEAIQAQINDGKFISILNENHLKLINKFNHLAGKYQELKKAKN